MAREGGTLEARGRNGWFQPASVQVFAMAFGEVDVQVFSSKPAGIAPILLRGRADQLMKLFSEVMGTLLTIKPGEYITIEVPGKERGNQSARAKNDLANK